jgi:DNA invertase Pin-like site-specific DNA recombinase
MKNKAFGYIRVSGKGQIKGDGFLRQEKAIHDYAQTKGIEIMKVYREKGVSGTLADRPALLELIFDLEKNGHGIKTVVVEKLDRLARDLMIQETIIQQFRENGVDLISCCEGPGLLDNDPTRKLVRQLMGAIAEYEKTMLVEKLKVARKRKKEKTGSCEGRKPYREKAPETVERIKELRKKPKRKRRKTYKEISEILNEEKIATLNGQPWNLQTVRNVLQ